MTTVGNISQVQVGADSYNIVGGLFYGEVDSTSTSTAFTVTIPNLETSALYDGLTVVLKNGVVTSAANFTININGLGAKPVYNSMATGHGATAPTRDTTIFNIDYTMMFIYNSKLVTGGAWICYRGYDKDIVVDSVLDDSSTNPIQNQAVENALTDGTKLIDVKGFRTDASGYSHTKSWLQIHGTSDTPNYTGVWVNSSGWLYSRPKASFISDIKTDLGNIVSDITTSAGTHTPVTTATGSITFNVPTKTSHLENDSGFITDADIPEGASKYTSLPANIATAAVTGTSNAFAPGDHVHKITSATITTALGYTPVNPNSLIEVMHYKGTKTAVSALPSTGNTKGDVWHVTANSSEYAWDGTEWQELGGVVDIPDNTGSSTTGISIADHSTTTITGVQAGTVSVTGVQATTTTASKITTTAVSIPNITSAGSASTWAFENINVPIKATAATLIPNVTAAGSGSFTQGAFTGGSFTQGEDSFTPNVPTKIDTSKFSGGSYSHTGFSGGSYTRGTFNGGSLNMTIDSTDSKKLNITFTAATHGNDSFTAATYGTDTFTAAKLNTGFYTAGTAASFTQGEDEFTPATHAADTHVHTPPTIGTPISIIGVQTATTTASHVKSGGNGTAPTLGTTITVTAVKSNSDVAVPIKATAATTVPVKNTSATTVVTSKTHSITDSGHTHTI